MKLTVKERLMLLELATIDSVSAACAYMNVSRDTYYRIKKAYEDSGVEALASKYRKVPNFKNRIPKHVEDAVLELSRENPAFGKKKISRGGNNQRLLKIKNDGLEISISSQEKAGQGQSGKHGGIDQFAKKKSYQSRKNKHHAQGTQQGDKINKNSP